MKTLLISIFISALFLNGRCRKDNLDSNGLPPATQSGKNTLGLLLNGQPWTPQGFNGTANLSIDVDLTFNNGIFGISAYRILSDSNRTYFGVGLKDSLNLLSIPATIQLTNQSLYGINFLKFPCAFYSSDSSTQASGSITISKLDRTNRIIAGTFSATLSMSGCAEIIQITEGRFDMKY
jgi:hypothetical protein